MSRSSKITALYERLSRDDDLKSVLRHEETSVVWKDNHFHYTHDLMTS